MLPWFSPDAAINKNKLGGDAVKTKSWSALVAMAFLIIGLSVSPLAASQYLGEVSWAFHQTYSYPPNEGDGTIIAGISRVGGSYYEIQGQINGATLSGGGVLVGSNLILSGTMTEEETGTTTFHGSMIFRMVIDKSSFGGTFRFSNYCFSTPDNQWGQSYTGGTLTVIGNPIPLVPNSQPSSLLLLE